MKMLVVPFFALALASMVGAQAPSTLVRRNPAPLQSVHLDLGTGTLTRGPSVANRVAATVADFNNNDLGGFVGLDSGGGFCEWFDAGLKGFTGNQSDLMSSIVFPYCSAMRDPGVGGPGGSLALGFYEGYVTGGGTLTTTVAAFTLRGLPANSFSSCFTGGFVCRFLEVSFDPLIAFADGPIGYSWKFIDVGTTGVLAGTWPFLACSSSCSAAPTMGMDDLIDRYCPPGFLRSTFTFGTTSGTFTSIAMEIREASDVAASVRPFNASVHPNADLLATGPAVLGGSFAATLTRGAPSQSGTFALLVRTRALGGDGVGLPAGIQGRLLVTGALLGRLSGTHDGQTGSVSTAIPPRLELLCLPFAAQAAVLTPGIALSSAVEGTVGTF